SAPRRGDRNRFGPRSASAPVFRGTTGRVPAATARQSPSGNDLVGKPPAPKPEPKNNGARSGGIDRAPEAPLGESSPGRGTRRWTVGGRVHRPLQTPIIGATSAQQQRQKCISNIPRMH